jgi:hypothetical protein
MKLNFAIDGASAELSRNWFSGRLALKIGNQTMVLQSPWNPATHFSFSLQRRWQTSINGHAVVVEKDRPLLLAGVRSQTYRVFVDGKLVAEQSGY